MSPRRPKKAAQPPPPPAEWTVKPASRAALRGWEEVAEAEPDLMRVVKERLRTRPLDRSDNPNRTHRLKPPLDLGRVGDLKLPQWQHEMTASGRIWYCVDADTRTVWVTKVSLEPPRETH